MPCLPRPVLHLLALSLAAPALAAQPVAAPAATGRAPLAACFAPDTPRKVVEEMGRRLATAPIVGITGDQFQFGDNDRWSRTATDGSGLGQGDPTTLTWSYAPDGTSVCGYLNEPMADSELHEWLDALYGDSATWHALFQQIFDRWGELTGITYVYEPNDDGAAFDCAGLPSGVLGVRGDIRISAHYIDGNSKVLAYNFFPNAGEMVIDSYDSFFDDLRDDSLSMRNVLSHEHGHGLGLSHVCPIDQTKLMEPYATTRFDGPQADDILAANRGYGDALEEDDSPATAAPLIILEAGTNLRITDESIDDDDDQDYLAFTTSEPVAVTIEVDPVGSTYLSGPQLGDGSCSAGSSFDSHAIHDLAVALLDQDGTTVLASADMNGAGVGETLQEILLATPGTYYVRVSGDSTNQAQLYEIAVSADIETSALLEASMTVTPDLDPYPVGSELTHTITVVNSGTDWASGVVVQACLDPALDPLQVTILDGGALDQPPAPAGCNGDWITWQLPFEMPPTALDQVRFRAVLPVGTSDGTIVATSAQVHSDLTPAVVADTVTARVCSPSILLDMTADAASYREGEEVTWTLTVANSHAECPVTGLVVDDTIDLDLVEDEPALTWTDPAGGSSVRAGDTITWALPSLGPGGTAAMTVRSTVESGVAGGSLCNMADGRWNETLDGSVSPEPCATILSGCPESGIEAVAELLAVNGPGAGAASFSWLPAADAEEYDLWRIEGDKTLVGDASRDPQGSIYPVAGCADPDPISTTSCVDTTTPPAGGVHFYQVRGVCGGSEGAL